MKNDGINIRIRATEVQEDAVVYGAKPATRKFSVPVRHTEVFSEEDLMKQCPNGRFTPTILPAVDRIIAIGDIHGDLNLAINSFKIAKLIDDNGNWIAQPPHTVVVQVGDQIDSCRPIRDVMDCQTKKYAGDIAEDVSVLQFFNAMHEKAAAHGGAVYSLLGNHELMNAEEDFTYVSYENYYNFTYKDGNRTYRGPSGRTEAFAPGGPIAKMLACTRSSVLIIGSNLFVHAGLLPVMVSRLDYLNLDANTKLKYLNFIIRKWLLKQVFNTDEWYIKNSLVNSNKGPFWTRVFGTIPTNLPINSPECVESVKKTLEVFKIGKIVVGHSPQLFTNKDGINGTCYESDGNHLYRIDGGFSRAFSVFNNGNLIQVLEILHDTQFNIITNTIPRYVAPPPIGISETEMKKIAAIYSQGRVPAKLQPK